MRSSTGAIILIILILLQMNVVPATDYTIQRARQSNGHNYLDLLSNNLCEYKVVITY